MKIPTSTKLLIGALALSIGAVPVSANIDLTGLTHQVETQQVQLNNHDARITNNEKDIAKLHQDTNTEPAADHVEVPSKEIAQATELASPSSTTASQPAVTNPAPEPTTPPRTTKTITAVNNDRQDSDFSITTEETGLPLYCNYTYDDGSTSRQWGFPKQGFFCKGVGEEVPR